MNSIPWVEKYRPVEFDTIILDGTNRRLLENIINHDIFPNLLAHGFPGTGKTTTIMNLLSLYFEKKNVSSNGMIIHLNASDERGIDIIRNQIYSFVTSKSLFARNALKFVVLDEIDYMTKTAQQALRYLIKTTKTNVRFCLICNYISRIDDGLQSDFLQVRFNTLPKESIVSFLQTICTNENLDYTKENLMDIINFFKNDIRSMINFLQCNTKHAIIETSVYETFLTNLCIKESTKEVEEMILQITLTKKVSEKQFILFFLHFLMEKFPKTYCIEFLDFVEDLLHNNSIVETKHFIQYAAKKLVVFKHLLI
jgi:replication factor C subunit 3/5